VGDKYEKEHMEERERQIEEASMLICIKQCEYICEVPNQV